MAIKEHLAVAERAMQEAQKALDSARREAEEFQRFFGGNGNAVPATSVRRPRTSRGERGISLRELVYQTLKPAGRAMTVTEMLEENETRNLGYRSGADDPADSVDIQLYKLAKRPDTPIQKVAARTWQWVEETTPSDHNQIM